MYFWVNEFEVGVNDSIFSSNEQQTVVKRFKLGRTITKPCAFMPREKNVSENGSQGRSHCDTVGLFIKNAMVKVSLL